MATNETTRSASDGCGATSPPPDLLHYVTKVLLKQFKISGSPLQSYQVQTGKWIPKSPETACAADGYTQLLVPGQPSGTLEGRFSAVETHLPKIFKALEEAAKKPLTELCPAIYENMCKYCAFLSFIALPAKPGAVWSFVKQINMELEKGEYHLLCDPYLNIPEQIIDGWRKEHAFGGRVIVESENLLQSLYWFQFHRAVGSECRLFLDSEWTISNSPVELAVSDVGLVTLPVDNKALWSILPIGRHLLLERVFYVDPKRNSSQPLVTTRDLTAAEAEYRLDAICASAVTEIICSSINPNIPVSINRAKENKISFLKLVNPKAITSAGLAKASNDFIFRVVSGDDFKKYMDSLVQPERPPQAL